MSDGADRSGDRALAGELRDRVAAFLRRHHPAGDRLDFLRAQFDAGLAWVHYPVGLGGPDLPRHLQPVVDDAFTAAGAPDNQPRATTAFQPHHPRGPRR